MKPFLLGLALLVVAAAAASAQSGRTSLVVASIRLDYPGGFAKRSFAGCGEAITQLPRVHCVRGVVVAGYRLNHNPELGAPGAFFPHNGVALEVYPVRNLVLGRQIPPRLSLSEFRSWSTAPRPSAELQVAAFKVGRMGYMAFAWVGGHAPRADRAALASMIASIRRA